MNHWEQEAQLDEAMEHATDEELLRIENGENAWVVLGLTPPPAPPPKSLFSTQHSRPARVPQGTSGMAIASVILTGLGSVLAVLGGVLGVILAAFGLLLAYVARSEIRGSDGGIGGAGFVTASLIIGWLVLGLAAFALLVFGSVGLGALLILGGS